ncbi:MAG: peptidylprolyl isomerase [Paludibacteraceae bacterium]|nr:peptidylprolyl isomerase [Paludibacteraceae bacterium]MBQ5379559.1 peptidylprolyl isomerase [Paludibacteraceae bacterium]
MKKVFFFIALAAMSMSAVAQSSSAPQQAADADILMTINGKPVSTEEFLYIYEKNNQAGAVDPKSMEEYLDMFINFKLKVAEGEAQGIDTTEAFRRELKGYRAQATPKYLQDEAALDSMIELSWRHMTKDRRASHIAIFCPMSAGQEQVDSALALINEARIRVTVGKEVLKGKGKKAKLVRQPVEDFHAVSSEVSSDSVVRATGGELGWITPFRYVYPLEEAVYNTAVGGVSEVFRTQYGFHIVLVEEERDHIDVKARHIMKMVPRGNDSIDALMRAQIDSIATIATAENFAELAQQLSDDRGSSMRGGDLGWFGKGMMVKEFEDAAFSLQPGQISAPIRTAYGWHIILKEGERATLPLDSMRTQIQRQVMRDERAAEADKSFIRKARAEYNLPAEMSDADVKAFADAHLEEKYPDLRNLVQEYHDGILLFEVSLREVWDKAAKDTAGLEAFFAAHKKEYTWEQPRWKGYIIQAADKTSAKAAQAIIKNAHPDSIMSYINHRVNLDSLNCVKVQYGMWEQGKMPIVDKYGLKLKGAEFTPSEALPYIVCVGRKLKAPEVWSDEKGKVTTEYQDWLEAQWVKALREKYPVVINQEVWERIKK